MNNKNFLSNIRIPFLDSPSSDVRHDRRLTVGSPSGLDAKWKQNPFMRFAVVLTLIFTIGSGNVWGAEGDIAYTLDFTAKTASNNSYTNTWTYGDFSLYAGSNNSKNWAYVRFGGKGGSNTSSTKTINSTITSTTVIASTKTIKQITIEHTKVTSGNYTANKCTLQVASNSDFSSIIDTRIIDNPVKNGTSFNFTPNEVTVWPASSYYKITIGATIKGTSNIGVEIAKVKFVEGASGGGCSNQVNITNSSTTSVTHGSFDVDKTGSQDACSALSVTVTPNPDDHYHVATVSATNPATTGTAGAAMYNGDGTYTITYSANAKGNSTISVTFAADPTYTVTWAAGSNPSFNTQTDYAETALTSPGTPSAALYCPGGKEFVGWTATPIVGEDDEAPGDLFTSVAGKSIPVGGTTYYAVFATNGGGSDPDTDTEHGKTTTPYVANEGWTASAGGTYTSSGNYSVSPSIKFSSNNNYVQSPTYADAITNVTFWHKNQAGAGYLKIYVSTDGSSFTELTGERITLTANQYTVGTKDIDLDYEDGYKAVKIVFDRTSGNCCIDEIAVTYGGGASYSDYATTCASCNTNPTVGTASLKGSSTLNILF